MPFNFIQMVRDWGMIMLIVLVFLSLISICWWRVQQVKKEKRDRAVRMKVRRGKRSALPPSAIIPYKQQIHMEAPERRSIILVVDDSPSALANVLRLLSKTSHRILSATNGVEAWTLLQDLKVRPDLLITDIDMPRMNGFELLKLVREDYILTDVPVILMTSNIQKQLEAPRITQDYDGLLHKPFDPDFFLEQVTYYLPE